MSRVNLISCASGYDCYLMDESFHAWREEDAEEQGGHVNGDILFDVDSKYVTQHKDAEGKVFFIIGVGADLKNIKEVGVDIQL